MAGWVGNSAQQLASSRRRAEESAGARLRAVSVRGATEGDDAVEELDVAHAGALRRRRQLLARADVGIGIGVEEPEHAMRIEPVVDAGVPGHLEDPIDAPA